jgi:predicted 3-demethylubiquinone-9 3-methyltransferase (glyoxalase superfamily)
VPTVLGQSLQDQDREKAASVTRAMLRMKKLDVEALNAAYEKM